jgi:predicted neutral ceramidase superfamily lipid hydrolase
MKRINLLVIIFLTFLTIYLLYRLCLNAEYNRIDYILLIFLFVIGSINSLIISNRRKKGKQKIE